MRRWCLYLIVLIAISGCRSKQSVVDVRRVHAADVSRSMELGVSLDLVDVMLDLVDTPGVASPGRRVVGSMSISRVDAMHVSDSSTRVKSEVTEHVRRVDSIMQRLYSMRFIVILVAVVLVAYLMRRL